MSNRQSHLLLLLSVAFSTALSGCQTVKYYKQIVHGHCEILGNRRSITMLIADKTTPEQIKQKLSLILSIREFAQKKLNLPVKENYLTYADINRQYVVWNVFAAPEFSLVPKQWCYPFIGCASYRGFFSKQDAALYAEQLEKENYDVFVGGVSAYSTLGWFSDPVLSTFMYRPDESIVSLIFHELAHQRLYIQNDTVFNESFATAVEQEGMRRWINGNKGGEIYDDYLSAKKRHQEFVQLVLKYRGQLDLLYRENMSPSEKRDCKESIFKELKEEYSQVKQKWGGDFGYDSWFCRKLNNAQLITISTYYDFVPAFLGLLKETGNSLERFYDICQDLSKKPKEERDAILKRYLADR